MAEDLRHKLTELKSEMASVRDEVERTLSEIYEIENKRRSLILRIRELRANLKTYRDRLNALREEIKGLNETLTELKRERQEAISSIRNLRERVRAYLRERRRPQRGEEDLEREISSLEWLIQTSPLPLDEEKNVIERIRSLEKQLQFYRELRFMREEIRVMGERIRETKERINACIKAIAERVSERERVREGLAGALREINNLRLELDRVNRERDEKRAKLSELRSKYRDLANRVAAIKRGIREDEERRRAEREAVLKEKIRREVSEKIRRGEKVSLEELKILMGDSVDI